MSAEILHFFGVLDAPNRIRELRLAAGLSQQALGDRVGVSKVTVSDLERGNMKLDTEYMRRFALALGGSRNCAKRARNSASRSARSPT